MNKNMGSNNNSVIQGYDIIGDIHGCNKTLTALLEKLGYKKINGNFSHPDRKVIFLGDFIDRGPGQREVISIVRPMIEKGYALAVMGNHEFNAIAFATLHSQTGEPLRPHTPKNINQHQAFIDAYKGLDKEYADVIAWFKTLPLWLDLGDLRVIHACWDFEFIDKLAEKVTAEKCLTEDLLKRASEKGTWQYKAIETLIKGKEVVLKSGLSYKGVDGSVWHNMRVRWWDKTASTYQEAFIGPEKMRTHIPDDEIEGDHVVDYAHHEPPVFLGHYWLEGDPVSLASNIACLDYSVAKPGGKLVAYCWQGEAVIDSENFVWVRRCEPG